MPPLGTPTRSSIPRIASEGTSSREQGSWGPARAEITTPRVLIEVNSSS